VPSVELGTHLHGETIDPDTQIGLFAGKSMRQVQCELSEQSERAQLNSITQLFTETFGYHPRSFRAGRFGIGNNTLRLLAELGYEVDSSVTPGLDWKLTEGRSDHSSAPLEPYPGNENRFDRQGTLPVLEVPVTIRPVHRYLSKLADAARALDRRPFRRVVSPLRARQWLRPYYSDAEAMIGLVKSAVGEAEHSESTVVLNMMFHSMEIIAGKNPYTRNDDEVNQYLEDLRRVFEFASENDCEFATLKNIGDSVRGTKADSVT